MERNEAGFARSLRKLTESRYVEKVFLGPEVPNLKRIGGANGFYRITPRGLVAYESAKKRAIDKLAILHARMDVPLPPGALEDLPEKLETPQAQITIHSDKMKVEDLNFFDYEDLAPIIEKFINSIARKNFRSALTGSLHDDRANFRFIPPDERRRPIEKQRHARFVTWLQNVHMMKFGVFLEFDGYSWLNSMDWNELNEWADRKDVEDERNWKEFQSDLPAIREAYMNRKQDPTDNNWTLTSLAEERKRDEMTEEDRKFWQDMEKASKEYEEDKIVEEMFRWYMKNKSVPPLSSRKDN
jgi:hypothetical protein